MIALILTVLIVGFFLAGMTGVFDPWDIEP